MVQESAEPKVKAIISDALLKGRTQRGVCDGLVSTV